MPSVQRAPKEAIVWRDRPHHNETACGEGDICQSKFVLFTSPNIIQTFPPIMFQDFRNYRYSLPMVPGLTVDLEAQRTCIKIPITGHNEVRQTL